MNIQNTSKELDSLHYNFDAMFTQLAEEWHIEAVFSEEEILESIHSYIETHREDLLEFLWDTGKVLVPMNSAEKFADIVIDLLEIDPSRVTKFKVTTYKDGVSIKKLMTPAEKEQLWKEMDLQMDDKVLMLEDLMDTGHTLHMLEDFITNTMAQVKVLCLLDKNVDESEAVRVQLWEKLTKIIDIWSEFVVWFWMDYDHRLGANIKWLWKIKEASIPQVTEILNIFSRKVEAILAKVAAE